MSAQITSVLRFTSLSVFSLGILAATLLPNISFAQTPHALITETCGSFSVPIQSYGAGMMHSPTPIQVANERVSLIHPTENCAVVQWTSSSPAASAVIFAELAAEPVTVKPTDVATFGYPHITTQNNAGLSMHTAVLKDLKPGVAYSYRLVTRSHPSAVPAISDAKVLIAGPMVVAPVVPPVVAVVPPVISVPTIPTPHSGFDAEKFPIVPIVETEREVATTTEALSTTTQATTTTSVPSALNAAVAALGSARSQEWKIWEWIKSFFANLKPSSERMSLESNIGLFEKDRYIVPFLFFLGLLFLLQQLVLPAFGVNLKSPLLYWLLGSVIVALISALFMLYYVTLVSIAVFLGLLAWYLLKSVPEDTPTKALAVVSDDFKKVEGIGPKIEELINKAGIRTYADLRKARPETIAGILNKGGEKFKVHDPKTWPQQAGLLADGKVKELKELQDSLKGGK